MLALYLIAFAALQLPYQAVGVGCCVAAFILLAPPFLRHDNSLLFRAVLCAPLYVPMLYIAVTTLSIATMIEFGVVGLVLLAGPLALLRDGRAEVSVRDIAVSRPLTRKRISIDEIASVEENTSRTGALLRFFGFHDATTSLKLEPWSHQRTLGRRQERIVLKVDPAQQTAFIAEVESLLMPDPFEDELLA